MALFEIFSTIVAEIWGGLLKHRNERILISDVTREIRLGALKNSQVRVSVPSRSRSRAVNVETFIGTYIAVVRYTVIHPPYLHVSLYRYGKFPDAESSWIPLRSRSIVMGCDLIILRNAKTLKSARFPQAS